MNFACCETRIGIINPEYSPDVTTLSSFLVKEDFVLYKIQKRTCKLQADISVYQEGLETEFFISPYNSDLSEMIEERADDEMVKKSLEPWS